MACGLPYTAIMRGHVSVDLLSGIFDKPAFRWLNFIVHALVAALLAVLSWESVEYALRSHAYGDVSNMMKIPKSPFQFAVAISTGLFAIVLILEAIRVVYPKHTTEKAKT